MGGRCRGVSGSTAQGAPRRGHGAGDWGRQRHTFLDSSPSGWCQVGTGSPELSFQTLATTAFCPPHDLSSRHPLPDGVQALAVDCGAAGAGAYSGLGRSPPGLWLPGQGRTLLRALAREQLPGLMLGAMEVWDQGRLNNIQETLVVAVVSHVWPAFS